MKLRPIIILLILTAVANAAAGQTNSVLSAGDWWKMEVRECGIYRLTAANVPALQGVSVDAISVYGAGGDMLPLENSAAPTADLQPVGIDIVDHNGNGLMDSGDEVLFFGEGPDVWRYSSVDERWELARHAYSTANYYYLTISANGTDVVQRHIATSRIPSADTTLANYTAVATVNNDLVNIFGTGQQWMGEKFSGSAATRNFTLTLPATASHPKVRYALASVSSATASFSVSAPGLSRTNTISHSDVYQCTLETLNTSGSSFTFNLTYNPGESSGAGYLDFIEINGTVPLTFGGGQLLVRDSRGLGLNVCHTVTGGGSGLRVWEVTTAGAERALAVTNGAWTDMAATARTYVLFDGSSYLSPASIEKIANQNLHSLEAIDYVAVCHPTLLEPARRLAAMHEIADGLNTLVVASDEVYNEFSSGKQDPMAIRALLRHLKAMHPDRPPRYLLLMGKATYDNRDLLGNNLPTMVTYETAFSFDEEGRSYCSDDILGYLDDSEGSNGTGDLYVSIGRLPAKSAAEADWMVDKILGYMTRRDLTDETATGHGDWRNYVALLADDADPSRPGDTNFAHSSENAANRIKTLFPNINIDKLYADAYHQQSGAIGSYYPNLNNALRLRINYGCLLLNYIGHGSAKYIGTERYVEPSDIAAFTNRDRLPLVVTSTCSYGRHDDPTELCGAEQFMLAPAGAVGVISAARMISHNERFNTDVLLFALDTANCIGDALRKAKNRTAVAQCIGLTGDPAMKLSMPLNEVVVTHINGQEVDDSDDTATVLSRVTVSGEVHSPDGTLLTDFDGMIYPVVYDREMRAHTLANDNPGTEVSFVQQKSVLYKGTEPVSGGRFEYSFIVPRDVAYQYAYGKLSHYARSGGEDAAGSYSRLLFGGLDENAEVGDACPTIRLFMGDTNFRNGGLTDAEPTLIAMLSDSVGINAAGTGLGHEITAVIDGNPGSLIVLGDLFEPNVGDSRSGTVRYTLTGLTPGWHTLTLKAWNIWGNSATAEISFRVADEDSALLMPMEVFPNPATEQATFHCSTSGAKPITSATLQIYSSHGALVASITPATSTGSYVVGPVVWNVSGVAPGLYLARLIVTTEDGETHQTMTKVAVR